MSPSTAEASALKLEDVALHLDGAEILHGIDLELPAGSYTCIMGASGAGKTSLLSVVAGHLPATRGRVLLGGVDHTHSPPARRGVATIFQEESLFSNLDVASNVAFSARVRGKLDAASRRRADELLAAVGLAPERFAARQVTSLSGGEARRVALARALFAEPRLLLLDEPLTGLDRRRRGELRHALRELSRTRGGSFLHATHDAEDALALADQLIVVSEGGVAAAGDPGALYHRPPSLEVAQLLGDLVELPDGLHVRPESLHFRADASGRFGVRETFRRSLGGLVELELEWTNPAAPRACWLRAAESRLVDGPVCSLDVSDEDVMKWER